MSPRDILIWRDGFWCYRENYDPKRGVNYRVVRECSLEWRGMTSSSRTQCHMNAFDIAITDTFYALDASGRRYEILRYNAMAGDAYKGRRDVPGSTFYELSDGSRVEEVGNEQFTVYLDGGPLRLTREPTR